MHLSAPLLLLTIFSTMLTICNHSCMYTAHILHFLLLCLNPVSLAFIVDSHTRAFVWKLSNLMSFYSVSGQTMCTFAHITYISTAGSVVKEYQELTPLSRICTCMAHAGVPYFQMGREKKRLSTHHQIFRVCRGHKDGHNETVLRGSDKGIWRGGRKIFDPPYCDVPAVVGGQGMLEFLWPMEIYRPHVQTKHRALEFKRGHGERSQRNFAIFGGCRWCQSHIVPPRGYEFIFCATDFRSLLIGGFHFYRAMH